MENMSYLRFLELASLSSIILNDLSFKQTETGFYIFSRVNTFYCALFMALVENGYIFFVELVGTSSMVIIVHGKGPGIQQLF